MWFERENVSNSRVWVDDCTTRIESWKCSSPATKEKNHFSSVSYFHQNFYSLCSYILRKFHKYSIISMKEFLCFSKKCSSTFYCFWFTCLSLVEGEEFANEKIVKRNKQNVEREIYGKIFSLKTSHSVSFNIAIEINTALQKWAGVWTSYGFCIL